MTLLCPFTVLGTGGPPLAPSRDQCVLAAALPTAGICALFHFTLMQQPQGPMVPGLGECRTNSIPSRASGCLGQYVSGRKGAW